MSSSVRRATVAATNAAAAATGPLPPLPFLNIDSQFVSSSSDSSAASTTSAVSNASELSHMLSEIITSAILSSITRQQQRVGSDHANDSERNASFSLYLQMPLRQSDQQNDPQQSPRLVPVFILGYRTSSSSSSSFSSTSPSSTTPGPVTTTSNPDPVPSATSPQPPFSTTPHHSNARRPRSIVSTTSSLATLQSMPLSHHSNRNSQRRESGQWLIYVISGQQPHPAFSALSENPTYEDLLWLSSVLGPARPTTTTQAAIDAALPVVSWSDDTKKNMTAERCPVCLDDFVLKQPVRVLKCHHVFHMECVDRWLCEAQNSCPVCRGVPVDQPPEQQAQQAQ
ncbi:hypothetical protein EC973_006578 [Apophysomyces ossiformis]|uniref:RING-type domain-containing protein n=1 Tax=Apophysomyces ossiformis TaxID=679940 RepID=A0A8H7BND0_9FUNG|nr:hypothetical protein EC973_006578 [Apophysomyces ossiformis]